MTALSIPKIAVTPNRRTRRARNTARTLYLHNEHARRTWEWHDRGRKPRPYAGGLGVSRLVCGEEYVVTVVTSRYRDRSGFSQYRTAKFTLVYCGGSCVDKDGHRLGLGVWAHAGGDHRSPQYSALNVAHVRKAVGRERVRD